MYEMMDRMEAAHAEIVSIREEASSRTDLDNYGSSHNTNEAGATPFCYAERVNRVLITLIPNLIENLASHELLGVPIDRAAAYQTALIALYSDKGVGATKDTVGHLARNAAVRRDLVEHLVTPLGLQEFAEWMIMVSLDAEKKSICQDLRNNMAHQSSIEYQELCESGEMQNMMCQNLYDEDEGKCRIVGTALDPMSAPLRRSLTGIRPGTRPLIVIPDNNEGIAPGLVRDRKCSPDITELGST